MTVDVTLDSGFEGNFHTRIRIFILCVVYQFLKYPSIPWIGKCCLVDAFLGKYWWMVADIWFKVDWSFHYFSSRKSLNVSSVHSPFPSLSGRWEDGEEGGRWAGQRSTHLLLLLFLMTPFIPQVILVIRQLWNAMLPLYANVSPRQTRKSFRWL